MYENQGRESKYYNIQDNAVYTIGNHSLRFGGQAEFYRFAIELGFGRTPTYNIADTQNPNTPALETGLFPGTINSTDLARANALRFLLGGIVGAGSVTTYLQDLQTGYQVGAPLRENLNFNLYSGYINDQWRIRPNLTLNLGVRYEYYTPLENPEAIFLEAIIPDPNNLQSITNANGKTAVVGSNTGNPGRLFNPDKNNFSPNINFAYSPGFDKGLFAKLLGGGTVIRGGFRVNYINDEYVSAPEIFLRSNSGLQSADIIARRPGTNDVRLRTSFEPIAGFDPLPGFSGIPLPAPQTSRTFAEINTAGGRLAQALAIDPNYRMPKSYEYTFGIQRNIGFNTVLEIRYVGSRSDELIGALDLNEVNLPAAFVDDFRRAQQNCRLQGALQPGGSTAFDPAFLCTNAGFNANIPGSQQLAFFDQNISGGFLTNSTVRSFIQQGRPGSLAQFYIQNGVQGAGAGFQNTSEIYTAGVLTNVGKYRYDALQAEVRRRFSNGLSFQANYAFAKVLTDIPTDDQNRYSFFQDQDNPSLNYGRADYDRTHTFNFNAVYELPFGKGKKFLNQGGWVNAVFGGFRSVRLFRSVQAILLRFLIRVPPRQQPLKHPDSLRQQPCQERSSRISPVFSILRTADFSSIRKC